MVAVDLKEIDKRYILHLIEHAIRYSAAEVVKSKKKEDKAEAIIKNWIATFGAPRVILSDNGSEFNNEPLREVCEQFKMIKKLKLDNNNTYSIDAIVPWAISAKNALQCSYGFSPNQLVLGKSAN